MNEIGIKKILGHEYKSNRVEIILEINSKSIGDSQFKYKTHTEYEIDITGAEPIIKLITENMS